MVFERPTKTTEQVSEQVTEQVTPQVSEQVGEQVGEQVSGRVGEQVIQILKYCFSPKSKQELLNHIGLKPYYLNYKRHLYPLIEEGLIEMTIPDKPNSRLQKYRLTEKGRELLEK